MGVLLEHPFWTRRLSPLWLQFLLWKLGFPDTEHSRVLWFCFILVLGGRGGEGREERRGWAVGGGRERGEGNPYSGAKWKK